MTVDHRTLIELADIIAIEYECPHCHVRHSVPLNTWDGVTEKCPNCRTEWVRATHTSGDRPTDVSIVHNFMLELKRMQERDFGAVMRLEIKGSS